MVNAECRMQSRKWRMNPWEPRAVISFQMGRGSYEILADAADAIYLHFLMSALKSMERVKGIEPS